MDDGPAGRPGWIARFDPAAPPAGRVRIEGVAPAAAGDEALRVWVEGVPADAGEALASWRRHSEQGGERAMEHLRGPFVLLAEDRRTGCLTAVRDHLGLEPLFYAERGGVWFLSPWLDLLAQHPEVAAPVDRTVLAERLLDRWGEPGETIFTGVRQIVTGTAVSVASIDNSGIVCVVISVSV